jgi:hypothetical protein
MQNEPDREREVRLRPPRPPRARAEAQLWASAFRRMQIMLQAGRRARKRLAAAVRHSSYVRPPHIQRCSVRITYSRNKGPGQWKAHGRYLERESATGGTRGKRSGFDGDREGLDLADIANSWQRAGDERLFKIIVSPEFGEQMDLVQHTRELVSRMERDLYTKLEWAAVTHFNTDHPHVHIVLRGLDDKGVSLRLQRDYIRHGVRRQAEELATNQLGYRTAIQVLNAQANETKQQRYTSLDQIISRRREADSWLLPTDYQGSHFVIQHQSTQFPLQGDASREREFYIGRRLRTLETMGLDMRGAGDTWYVRNDFEQILRTMQKTQDRQKTLARHGALPSDPRLQVQLPAPTEIRHLEGRVLVHGEEEETQTPYMLLEGTDGKIHLIYHTQEIDAARAAGKLKPDHFAVLQKKLVNTRPSLLIEDLGEADKILSNRSALRQAARRLIRQGVFGDLQQTAWGGWLGKYHNEVRRAGEEELQREKRRSQGR